MAAPVVCHPLVPVGKAISEQTAETDWICLPLYQLVQQPADGLLRFPGSRLRHVYSVDWRHKVRPFGDGQNLSFK
jgi:hypothetical protein